MRQRAIAALVAAGMLMTAAESAFSGQVRINVSDYKFSPINVTLNLGDQVVWVWTGGSHSVTSGTNSFDGAFNSEVQYTSPAGTAFTWKADHVGFQPYYCQVHLGSGMKATLEVVDQDAVVSAFRITEVRYNVPGGQDLIEIANLGDGDGNFGRYRLSTSTGVSVTVPFNSVLVSPGTRLVIHVNATGSSTSTNLYLPGLPELPASGALALDAPNTAEGTSLDDATQLVDYVEWNAGGGPNEATAAVATFWSPGEFVPGVADGHSIEFCGSSAQHGRVFWFDNDTPNFGGADNCATPTTRSTWGRIKTLYR